MSVCVLSSRYHVSWINWKKWLYFRYRGHCVLYRDIVLVVIQRVFVICIASVNSIPAFCGAGRCHQRLIDGVSPRQWTFVDGLCVNWSKSPITLVLTVQWAQRHWSMNGECSESVNNNFLVNLKKKFHECEAINSYDNNFLTGHMSLISKYNCVKSCVMPAAYFPHKKSYGQIYWLTCYRVYHYLHSLNSETTHMHGHGYGGYLLSWGAAHSSLNSISLNRPRKKTSVKLY